MTAHRLPLALACAWCLVFAGLPVALAQFPPPPGQQAPAGSSPFPPAGGQGGGFGPPGGGGFGPPPGGGGGGFGPPGGGPPPGQQVCAQFPALRQEAETRAMAIQSAGQKKLPREQVCKLFNNFAATEAKMIKFLVDNRSTCGIPGDAISGARANHAKTQEIRKAVCATGPASGPSAPTLSDALGGPIIADDAQARQPGRGTFDTLTGNVLSR